MASSGLKLAVKYSYRPFILGFCGPQKSHCRTILTNYLLGAKVKEKSASGRSPEGREVEDVLSHEVLHWAVQKVAGKKACLSLDNVSSKLLRP